MRGRQTAVVTALVVFGIALVAVPAAGLDIATQSEEPETAGLGTQMTSFAQSTAVEASSSVDAGMWEARIANQDDPAADIEERTVELEQRLAELENTTERLSDDNQNSMIYTARASAVRTELAAVRSNIDDTVEIAQQNGVNTSKLDELRSRAANVTGPEISEIARNLTDAPMGPPGETPGDEPQDDGQGPPDDERGPPDDDSNPPEENPDSPDGNSDPSTGGPDESDNDNPSTDGVDGRQTGNNSR